LEKNNDSLSTIVSNNEFDTLLKRIKTVVDQNLSDNSIKTRQKSPTKRVKSSLSKRRLQFSLKSQSFDGINSG
jgi:ribosomal protein S21